MGRVILCIVGVMVHEMCDSAYVIGYGTGDVRFHIFGFCFDISEFGTYEFMHCNG